MSKGRAVFSIRRLRWALVAGAGLLVAVLAGYVGYARYRMHQYLARLPALVRGLEEETNGFSRTKYSLDRKTFAIHAAKQITHKNGKMTLHDVGIEMYGNKGDRADHIHGSEFEYDEKNGVVTAVGEVYIDLSAPPRVQGGRGVADDASRVIHLKTSGLVYRQKEEMAGTENPIEFTANSMSGTAVGASYDAGRGIVVLQSQVRVSGVRATGKLGGQGGNERPMVLTAGRAELDRESNVVVLEGAKLVSAGGKGAQTAAAQHAVVRLTADGTPKHVDANGSVALRTEGRGTVTSDRLEMDLNAAGQPSSAHLMGVVRFVNDTEAKQEHGKANDVRVAFDAQGRPVHALMTGAVEANVTAGASVRWVGADGMELALAGGGKEPVRVRAAKATAGNGARIRLVDVNVRKDAKGKVTNGLVMTNVKADVLTGKFADGVAKTALTEVDGMGRTMVERTLADAMANGGTGATQWRQTGTGESLRIDFRQGGKGQSEISGAAQRGSVKLVREAVAKKNTGVEVEHAEGDEAVYDGDSDGMTMNGQVKLSDAQSALFADRVAFDRGSGDVTAEGAVRVSYLQQGSTGEPMHVLAARAIAHKATGISEFFGSAAAGAGGEARMWQGGSQVEAPVLEFDRTKRTVFAHGTKDADVRAVKMVLVDSSPSAQTKTGERKRPNVPVRVQSREMTYTDATREVVFRGMVQVNDEDGTMRSREATVYLAPKDVAVAKDAAAISLGGRVDHMVAVGGVEIEQPGRKASGEKLVYTEGDRTFVLTGTKTASPYIVDETQGTVTGASLRFRSVNDSVEVLSGDGSERVHTTTRMKQKD